MLRKNAESRNLRTNDTLTTRLTDCALLALGFFLVQVAAITIGFGDGDTLNATYVTARLALAVDKLRAAKAAGATLALLPEEFCGVGPVTLESSSIFTTLATAAKELAMHVAFGIRLRAPPGDRYPNTNGYNTAVLLDPHGAVVGRYKKQWPCCVSPDGTVRSCMQPRLFFRCKQRRGLE